MGREQIFSTHDNTTERKKKKPEKLLNMKKLIRSSELLKAQDKRRAGDIDLEELDQE